MHIPHSTLPRVLPIATLASLAGVGISGALLRLAPEPILAWHLAGGVVTTYLAAVYLQRHWWMQRDRAAGHPNARSGYVAGGILLSLLLSGLLLVPATNYLPLRRLHAAATALVVVVLAAHALWRLRFRPVAGRWAATGGRPEPPVRGRAVPFAVSLPTIVGALVVIALAPGHSLPPGAAPAGGTVIKMAHNSLAGLGLPAATDCAACHHDIAGQWQRSGHAHGSRDAYYQAVAALFIEENGVEASRFCAGCHDPVGLIQGEITTGTQATNAFPPAAASGNLTAYRSRSLGVTLALSSRAAEGVTCALCHQAAPPSDHPFNGSLAVSAGHAPLPGGLLAQLSLRSAPAGHQTEMRPPAIRQAGLCGNCHNVILGNGLPVEPTFDEWSASGYPEQGKTCESCHLPFISGQRADSSLPGQVRAHGGIPGAPSSLPGMGTDLALLRQAATLQASLSPGGTAELVARVTVTNTGAGHDLPTGASDLREIWIAAEVRDAAGRVLWSTGGRDRYGELVPGTAVFHKVLGDADGRPIALHRIWAATHVLADTSLRPGEARHLRYEVPVDPAAPGPFVLAVRLLYRDVPTGFAEFALGHPVADLPTWELAAAQTSIENPSH